MKAKRCPLCGGEPQFVHYAIPQEKDPDAWEFTEDGFEPMILFKRLECKECKATTCGVDMVCDDAIKHWNEGHIFQWMFNENVTDVQQKET